MFDLIFLLYIAANMFLGWRFGVSRRLVHFAGFYLGLLFALVTSVGMAKGLGFSAGDHPQSAHFFVYLAEVLLVTVIFEVLGFAYASLFRFISAIIFDRLLGAALALVASVLEIAMLLFMFSNMIATTGPSGSSLSAEVAVASGMLKDSPTANLIKNAENAAVFIFRPAIPDDPATFFAKSFT